MAAPTGPTAPTEPAAPTGPTETRLSVGVTRVADMGITGMTVHVAAGTDRLADGLAALLADPLPDPFAQELVVVPAKGVERWLTQRLSHRLGVGPRGTDGVCAGVRFVSPRSLVALLTGTERTDPWDPDRLVWSVLAAIDASLDEPWCATLARHLGEERTGDDRDLRRDRRWSVARRLADLFSTYAVQRPRLVADWSTWSGGEDTDGAGGALAGDLAWQPHLWRLVVAAVAAGGGVAPHERHRAAVEGIRDGRALALPDRLSLFGHTRLPVTEIELVRAVAEVREVHLWLPTPSPALWRTLGPVVADGPVSRHDDTSAASVHHPLLSALGRDTRELRRSLVALGPAAVDDPSAVDGAPAAGASPSLLGWLQADLRSDTVPDAAIREARVLSGEDRTVQVHAAHGMSRQVEVLREVLVGLLEDDPTLEPRDILVMCPDIDTYAPLFQAAFGLGGPGPSQAGLSQARQSSTGLSHRLHPAHRLRLRLADRGLAQTNPFIALATHVTEIAGGRATLSQVLDLASTAPVRHRFALGDKEIATITSWAEQSGVRWGLSDGLRAAYGLEKFPQNTWRAGLDRLLVGVAMSEDESLVGDVLPLDDVPSAEVDLVGRLAELVDRLEALVGAMQAASGVGEWIELLRDGVRGLGSASARDAWQVAQFERELAAVSAAATSSAGGDGPPLRLADLRALLEQRSGGRPTRANFRTGALTVCTMVPMRSVPHRVVCLVGLDDGVFPRATSLDGDDVMLRDPVTGERDARSEDRQLLLDAVLSARERLVITYTGANEVTGQDRPPAVPLGELLDALDTTATVRTTAGTVAPAGATGVRDRVLVRHPLQPYDERNLTPGALGGTAAFSFDRAALVGATAAAAVAAAVAAGRPPLRPPFLSRPLPARPAADLALRDLQEFFAHPARAFLRRRLDLAVPRDIEEPDDAMPLDLDGLQKWGIGDRMLRRLLDGVAEQVVFDAEQRRGELPPGALAEPLVKDVAGKAVALVRGTAGLRSQPSRSIDVTVDLGNGRRLTGVVPDVRGDQIVRVHYSTLAPKHRLATWLDLVVLTAACPGTPWSAAAVGWSGGRDRCPKAATVGPLDEGVRGLLADLVDTYDRGMREVVPLPVKTGHAWAEAASRRRAEDWPARQAWETDRNAPVPGEQDDPAYLVAYRGRASFAEVKGLARRDERWNDASSRLGQYAVRLWQPLLARERTVLL